MPLSYYTEYQIDGLIDIDVILTKIFLAPSSPPTNIQVEQTESPGELFITWLPPPKDHHNGVITGYHIKAVPQNVGTSKKLLTDFVVFFTPTALPFLVFAYGISLSIRKYFFFYISYHFVWIKYF